AGARAEPFVAGGLAACLAALAAYDLQGDAAQRQGSPTAIVVLVALVAGWTLGLRWAIPVWTLSAAISVLAMLTGALPMLNAVAIAAGGVMAGIGGHVGSTAFQASLGALDRQAALVRRAAALVSGSSSLSAIVDEILHATAEVLAGLPDGAEAGAAVLTVEDGEARLASTVGPSPVPAEGFDAATLAEALATDQPAAVTSAGRVALARIDAGGQPWGVLIAGRPRAHFGPRELGLLRAIADLAGIAIGARLRADEQERLRDRLVRVTAEAARDVRFETELGQVTRRLLGRTVQAVGADRGAVGRIDGDQLIVEADWPDGDVPRQAPRALSLAGAPGLLDALRRGEPFQHAAGAGETGDAQRHGLQYPLMAGGELVGVMSLSRAEAGPFDEAELHGLQQLTSLTALTLRSARLLVQARGLGQAKSEFLNMAAHELRTPLAVVRGYLSMMEDGTLEVPESTRRNVITLLCQKTDELSAMIEQILTAAQIQAGGVELQRQVFDLRESIDSAIRRARSRAEAAGVELWCQPLPEPVRVEAVATSIGRILDNLLGNAITYGNRLPVRLTMEVGDNVAVRVEDQGLGMSAEQQARLFEPFFRVDQPAVQGQAGTGLGLAVSRRLAELSGGSLELEWSQLGVGSTFVLRLPAAAGPAHPSSRQP
ncbi:MAG TPA: ATP-binding protein, partial [Candidatus Dormibacteraeota bacterium]|nr:ATP-binding protein [Candidatus Dormibacteraeota bacterium]